MSLEPGGNSYLGASRAVYVKPAENRTCESGAGRKIVPGGFYSVVRKAAGKSYLCVYGGGARTGNRKTEENLYSVAMWGQVCWLASEPELVRCFS